MANITQLLGTDSISSSRPVINSNFQLLNDDIADIQTLVDPINTSIQNISSATVESLTVVNNTTNIASFNTNGINLDTTVVASRRITMGAEIVKTGIVGSASTPTATNAPTSLTGSTYFIENNFTLPAGILGQEVTIINTTTGNVTISAVAGIDLSVTSLSLDDHNSTVTLRFINNIWYVIASYAATIS